MLRPAAPPLLLLRRVAVRARPRVPGPRGCPPSGRGRARANCAAVCWPLLRACGCTAARCVARGLRGGRTVLCGAQPALWGSRPASLPCMCMGTLLPWPMGEREPISCGDWTPRLAPGCCVARCTHLATIASVPVYLRPASRGRRGAAWTARARASSPYRRVKLLELTHSRDRCTCLV